MSAFAASPEKKSVTNRAERGNTPSTPDQHPYAIKTTSTAVLTRSNSRGYAASHQHLYIPNTPSPVSRHRHSKSDASRPSPRPLPIPPSAESPTKERKGHGYTSSDECLFPSVRARADTLPSALSPSPASPVKVDDLPSNPRVWTTSQLASYLITALRVKSGESLPLPLPVAKDIATFVKEARLNGRAFLRLNEQDLELMGVNNLWREALLNASRNLRQNVLKGRIWGFDSDDTYVSTRVHPYRSTYSSSSSSIDEISGSQESTPHKTPDRKGRVRGLVASLERTSSSGSGFSNHGSSTSEGDIITSSWVDDEAAFASGSETSDVEDRKARANSKSPLWSESTGLPDKSRAEVSSPREEPSIDELLTSGSMSGSWGAKAWEDMNIGETVKRITPEQGDENADAHDDIFRHSGSSSNSVSGKGGNASRADVRKQIKDVSARPLPSRPLPSQPESEANSPLFAVPHMRFTGRVDMSTQTDAVSADFIEAQGRVQHADNASSDQSENLQQSLSLLEHYKRRVAELEEKLSILERKGAEQAHVAYQSKAIETDGIPALDSAALESRSSRAANSQAVRNDTSPSLSKSVQVGVGGDTSARTPSTVMPHDSPIRVDDTSHLVSPAFEDGSEWRKYFDGREWDPLENGIRSYVLMVGLGVCAVVVSTILKRLAGKKY